MKLIYSIIFIFSILYFAQGRSFVDDHFRPRPQPRDYREIPEEKYTIVAPNNIRQGKPYNVYITGFSLIKTVRLVIAISGTSSDGIPVEISKRVQISPSNSKASLAIDTSEITRGSYKLVVEGGNIFEKRTLSYISKKCSLLILINKAIHRPGDLVKYKIFAIDSETKAVNPKSCVVSITDPRRNIISSAEDVEFINGNYAGELQLSSKASTGEWKIQAQCDDEKAIKVFEVQEYILPMVTASLNVDTQIPYSFRKVPMNVDVSYAFGGVASGTATITVSDYDKIYVKKNITVDSGSATLELDMIQDLLLTSEIYRRYTVNLVFYDPLTGTKATDTAAFKIVFKIYNFVTPPYKFMVPGEPYTFWATLKKYDGSPAPAGTEIKVIPQAPNTLQPQTLFTDENGSVSSSVDVPVNVSYINLRLEAKDANNRFIAASKEGAIRRGKYIQIKVLNEKPRLKERINLKIITGTPVPYVMLHILSKGILLKSKKLTCDQSEESSTFTYSFFTSTVHLPQVRFIAYYIDDNGDFVVERLYVQLLRDLNNYLKITPKESEVKPGAKAEFDIESLQYSTVSLVAVDIRNVMLGGASNITNNDVLGDLNEYSQSRTSYDWNNVAGYERTMGFVGLYILTNIPKPMRDISRPSMERRERFSRPSRPRGSENGVKIRKDFREDFFWRDVDIQNSACMEDDDESCEKGIETVSEVVPESITKYLIYGISMSKYDGVGLSDDVPTITTFLPFFISVELPYSIKRNEILKQDIILFNYLRRGQNVEVKIKKDPKFDAVQLATYGWQDSQGFYVQNIATRAGKNIKLQFALKPKVLGFIIFDVTAKGPLAGDGLKKQLRVIPEGIPRSITNSILVAIEESGCDFRTSLSCMLPNSAYLDTTEISTTVSGDIFGKAVNNLENLIGMPVGCGEQTMLSLAPDISIYLYLKSSNKLTPSLKGTLIKFINAGYQNELSYLRSDGSFSAFGSRDPSGSTWLTAYVGKYFYLAKCFTTIDSKVIKGAADFVAKQQLPNGSFKEPGRVIHADMQGGSGSGKAMTAFCTIFLTTILADYPEFKAVRNKALTFLETAFDSQSTTYELSVITYALQQAGSSKADDALELLKTRKTEKNLMLYWTMPAPSEPGYWYYNRPRSLDTETTSYALLTYISKDAGLSEIIKIVKYLISKANNFGGYSSSQDTVMAFDALSEFSKTFSLDANVKLELKPNSGNLIKTTVDSSNAFTLQSFELNKNARKLDVIAKSNDAGMAVVSLVCNFYEDPAKVVPSFSVSYKFKNCCQSSITFDACARYLSTGTSNMAVMIVTLPSGFMFSEEEKQNPDISKTEVTNQGSTVTFYFNSISNQDSCVTVASYRSKNVEGLQGGTIRIMDYYDTAKEGSTSYPIPDLNQPCRYFR